MFAGPVHLAHAARAERFEDFVVTEGLADQNDHSLSGELPAGL